VLSLAACCALLGALDVALAWRVRTLGERLAELSAVGGAGGARPVLLEGDALPELTLLDVAGRPVPLRLPGRHTATLLFVSSPSCGFCEDARPTWLEVARLAEGSHLRVLELVLDTEPAALAGRELPYEAVAAAGDAWSLLARVPGVPAALLVDEGGTVRLALYGDAHTGLREAVEEFLLS